MYWLVVALLILAYLLVLYKPSVKSTTEGFATVKTEHFATAAVHPALMPACAERSTDAQRLLARLATQDGADVDELRLLVSKLCCMEADIATPAAGTYRTQSLQFRTSHDTEPASTIVGRCLRNAVRDRDIDIIIEKFQVRGHELIGNLLGDCAEAHGELDEVVARTRLAMVNYCLRPQPTMDRPIGARDMGFWESEESDLSQYQGISAVPKQGGSILA